MKILLIEPSRYNINGKLIRNKKLNFPSLTLPRVASLTPEGIEVKIVIEQLEDIDFDFDCDVVGITAYTSRILRAYEIADEFRSRGRFVVMGGLHVSFESEEALQHADCVFIGEAEETWPKFLSDFKKGLALKTYKSLQKPSLIDLPIPRYSSMDLSRYAVSRPRGFMRLLTKPLFPVETSRGCPHGCTYCTVTSFFGGQCRKRPIPDIIQELQELKLKACLFVDDNIFADPARAKELFRALIPLKIRWFGQGSISAALDRELLKLARKSGCVALLVGIESISVGAISALKKTVNTRIEYDDGLKVFRQEGISVMASMMFGLPEEGEGVFTRTLDFLVKNKVTYTVWHFLVPFPGTALYRKFKEEGRLTCDAWWLDRKASSDYFYPRYDRASDHWQSFRRDFIKSYKKFYSFRNILKRNVFPPQKRFLLKVAGNMLLRAKISQDGSVVEN